eukprot:2799842-Rhodomonas_salina.1
MRCPVLTRRMRLPGHRCGRERERAVRVANLACYAFAMRCPVLTSALYMENRIGKAKDPIAANAIEKATKRAHRFDPKPYARIAWLLARIVGHAWLLAAWAA